jgi:hypothetical protein
LLPAAELLFKSSVWHHSPNSSLLHSGRGAAVSTTVPVDAGALDGDRLRVEVIGQVGDDVWIELPADPIADGRRLALPSARVVLLWQGT